MTYDDDKVVWHHGKCDCCQTNYTYVCHFGYYNQPDKDYKICVKCLNRILNTKIK